MITRACPGCSHVMCLACLKESWQTPIREVRLVNSFTPDSASPMTCCKCSGSNDLKFWPSTNVHQPRSKHSQPDLFEEGETKC
jgi:hypothetical protein